MLYLSFRFTLLFTSLMGLIHMIAEGNYTYTFFPVVVFLWALYTFFEEDDKEYRRRNGEYHQTSDTWYGDDNVYIGNPNYSYYDGLPYYNDRKTTYYAKPDKSKDYKGMVKKCKRSFKITIEKDNDNGKN